MKKKVLIAIIVVILAMALVIIFAACTGPNNGNITTPTIPNTPHSCSFGEWQIVREATDIEEGLKERYCVCGNKETQAIKITQPSVGFEFTLNTDEQSYSVTGIGTCTDTNIVIPSIYNGLPVTSIGERAFVNCDLIQSIRIPKSVNKILLGAIDGCTSLTKIEVDGNNQYFKSVDGNLYTKDGKVLVKYATGKNDTSFNIPDFVIVLGISSFSDCVSLTNIIIPNTVINIDPYAFSNCYALESVVIGDSVESLGEGSFKNCYLLSDLVMGNSLKTIGPYAFSDCKSLTSIIIPDSVNSIEHGAFSDCSLLSSVVIGKSVKSIDSMTFHCCTELKSIVIPDAVTYIGDRAFWGCESLTNISVPDSVVNLGCAAFGYSKSIQYNEYDNAYYIGNDENPYVVLVKAKSTDIVSCEIHSDTKFIYDCAFVECKVLYDIVIPKSVTRIGVQAFAFCSSITTLIIPNGVISIDSEAFWECRSLSSISIPNSVTNLGKNTFKACIQLEQNEDENAYYLGNNDNPYLILIDLKNSNILNFEINHNTTIIYNDVFGGCAELSSIVIPNSVKSIGENAFSLCTSLTTIEFLGNIEEWKDVNKGLFWKHGIPATEVICFDGKVSLE